MIPTKSRRTINIDGTEYEYCIRGHYNKDIYIKNLSTNQQIKWYVDDHWCMAVTPQDIRQIIELGTYGGIKATFS